MTDRQRLVVCASHSPGKERDPEHVEGVMFRKGLAEARALVEEFDPDYVVLFGGDHRRAFRHVVPTFAVSLSAEVIPEGPHEGGPLDVPTGIAQQLSEHLLASGIDIAVCRDVGLDHAFGLPLRDLLGGLDQRPVLPVSVNCAMPPLPTADRVLVIGTGGLSHSPPSLEIDDYYISDEDRAALIAAGSEAARDLIRPEWDEAFLAALESWDAAALASLTDSARLRAGAGANEVRTWLAAGAAGGGRPLHRLVYEPVREWITGMAVATSA